MFNFLIFSKNKNHKKVDLLAEAKQDVPDRLKQIARASVESGGRRMPRGEPRGAAGFGSVDVRKEQETKKVSYLFLIIF